MSTHPSDPTPTFDQPAGDGAPTEPETAATAASAEAASTRRPLEDILEDMQQPIRKRHLEDKPDGNGGTLTYCPWYRVARYVEHYTGGHWSKDLDVWTTDRRIFVRVTVTIDAADATVSRSATGTELLYEVDEETGEVKEIAYGDPSSNAESMAFRRACAQFGLGLGLYEG
jgi:hypothetical protein